MNHKLHASSRPGLKKSCMALGFPEDRLLLTFTPEETVFQGIKDFRKAFFGLLDGKLTVTEIVAKLQSANYDCTLEKVLSILDFLYEKKLLEDYSADLSGDNFDHAFGARYSRQALFFAAREADGIAAADKAMNILKKSHIVLFGMGGFGCHLLYELASFGIGKITVVDFDQVKASNLNRQILFREDDIGNDKVAVGEKISASLNSDIEYHFIKQKISAWEEMAEIIEGADCAILAADSPRGKIFNWMNRAAFSTNVPVLFSLGASFKHLRIGPLVVPGKTVCFDCSMPNFDITYDDPLICHINERHKHGVIGPYVMIAAGMMALELLKHLTGFAPCAIYNQRIDLDLLTYQTTSVPIVGRKDCPFCEKNDCR